MICEDMKKVCEDDDVKDAGDGCNTCHRYDNMWSCTEMYCPVTCPPIPLCMPGYEYVSYFDENDCEIADCVPMADQCDMGCESWFDGCNRCRCMDGKIGGCTKMYCDVYEEPRCLDEKDEEDKVKELCMKNSCMG